MKRLEEAVGTWTKPTETQGQQAKLNTDSNLSSRSKQRPGTVTRKRYLLSSLSNIFSFLRQICTVVRQGKTVSFSVPLMLSCNAALILFGYLLIGTVDNRLFVEKTLPSDSLGCVLLTYQSFMAVSKCHVYFL